MNCRYSALDWSRNLTFYRLARRSPRASAFFPAEGAFLIFLQWYSPIVPSKTFPKIRWMNLAGETNTNEDTVTGGSERAIERMEPTSGLEPLTCRLRIIGRSRCCSR